MSILRSELDAGRVDLGDVVTGETMPPVTPGDILRHEFMEPLGISQSALARAIGVPAIRISQILAGKRAVTADTALRLCACFGIEPQFWMNLQASYDLRTADRAAGDTIRAAIRPLHRPEPADGEAAPDGDDAVAERRRAAGYGDW